MSHLVATATAGPEGTVWTMTYPSDLTDEQCPRTGIDQGERQRESRTDHRTKQLISRHPGVLESLLEQMDPGESRAEWE